jgi:hypothetical protein
MRMRRHSRVVAFPILWVIKKTLSTLLMICGDKVVIVGGMLVEEFVAGGLGMGPVYRAGGANVESLHM